MSREATFETGSLKRLIQGFATVRRTITSENVPDVATAGSLLWDLTADQETVGQLLQSNLIAVVFSNLRACKDDMAQSTAFCADVSIDRMLELCFGILANLYAFPEAVHQLVADDAVLLDMLNILVSIDDPPALSELCRMLTSALSSAKGRSAWLPILLHKQQILEHMMLLIQSTLQPQLLQRSLELVAAMLHTSIASADEDATSASLSSGVGQQLWSAGLADALCAVLNPAAVSATNLAAPMAEYSEPGGWDVEDNTAAVAAGDASNLQHIEQKLYKKPEVLEALVGDLEQLAMQPEGVAVAVEHIPQLPELLLQLLAACSASGQHEVLELLLPVLVMYRAVLLPLLQQDQQVSVADHERFMASQQQQQQHRQPQELQYLVCIAGVLQDCISPDSLDALDAGWYLCAAATRGSWQQHMHEDAAAAGMCVQQAQQQLKGDAAAALSSMAVTCKLLEEFCRRLSLARVPETAVKYAEQCVKNLVQAIASAVGAPAATVAKEAAAAPAHVPSDVDPAVVGSLVRAVHHVAAVLQAVQQTLQAQQGTEDDALLQQQLAGVGQLQQDMAEMQKLLLDMQVGVF